MRTQLPPSYLDTFTWMTRITMKSQSEGVTTIAWAMPFSYAQSVFWERSFQSRLQSLTLSICAVLVAEACNIGLEPLVRPEIPALTAARLAWGAAKLHPG